MTDIFAYALAAIAIIVVALLMFYATVALVCLLIDRGDS